MTCFDEDPRGEPDYTSDEYKEFLDYQDKLYMRLPLPYVPHQLWQDLMEWIASQGIEGSDFELSFWSSLKQYGAEKSDDLEEDNKKYSPTQDEVEQAYERL